MAKSVNATEYSSVGQVAKLLNVKGSTVRKYALLIERTTGNENCFDRDSSNSRIFTPEQVKQLERLSELKNKSNQTLETAVKEIYTPDKVDTLESQNMPSTAVPKGTQELLRLVQANSQHDKDRDKAIEQLQQDNKELKDKLDHITKLLEDTPKKKPWLKRLFGK